MRRAGLAVQRVPLPSFTVSPDADKRVVPAASLLFHPCRFLITPFRPNVQMNDEAARGIWKVLKNAIVQFHKLL